MVQYQYTFVPFPDDAVFMYVWHFGLDIIEGSVKEKNPNEFIILTVTLFTVARTTPASAHLIIHTQDMSCKWCPMKVCKNTEAQNNTYIINVILHLRSELKKVGTLPVSAKHYGGIQVYEFHETMWKYLHSSAQTNKERVAPWEPVFNSMAEGGDCIHPWQKDF